MSENLTNYNMGNMGNPNNPETAAPAANAGELPPQTPAADPADITAAQAAPDMRAADEAGEQAVQAAGEAQTPAQLSGESGGAAEQTAPQGVRSAADPVETTMLNGSPVSTVPESVRQAEEARLSELKAKEDELSRSLKNTQKELEKEREHTVKEKRREVAGQYDKQLKEVAAQIKNVNDERSKMRSQGVKARIENETASLSAENKEQNKMLTNLFKDNHVPAICRTGAFYIYTMPHGIAEVVTALLSFAAVFGILPAVIHSFIKEPAFWHWIVIYLLDILIFGGIYVFLNSLKTKHFELVKQGRGIRDRIRANKKQIRKITAQIKDDKDDTKYGLQAYDDELSKLAQNQADIEKQKAAALEQFDAVTKTVLTDEINAKYQDSIQSLSAQLAETGAQIKELEEKIKLYGKTGDN